LKLAHTGRWNAIAMSIANLAGLVPLPYHVELRDYLKTHEGALWDWFASAQAQADYAESLRLELLKTAYRLGPENHAELHRLVDEVKQALDLTIPVSLYQSQQPSPPNASVYHLPGEAHLVLAGPVLDLLDAVELKSLIGHELAHYRLWSVDGGEFLVADRLLVSVANDPRAASSHVQSARRYRLYTEIFADRGSFLVTGDIHPVIASLVKIQTGLGQVSAASYLEQAAEIFRKSRVRTDELSHPEAYIRTRALALWAADGTNAEPAIRDAIEGPMSMDELDLPGQDRLTRLTRQFLELLLRPRWFQTQAVLGHAKLFFDNFQPTRSEDTAFLEELNFPDARLRDYWCYLMLDFVAVDPDLEDIPLAAAFELSKSLGIEAQFEKLALKELKMKPRDLQRIKAEAPDLLTKAETQT
jgi:hypothetical protein